MIFRKLQILFALIAVVLMSLLFLLAMTWHKSTQPEEGMMYCGVIDSAVPALEKVALNHPGRALFERNCAPCHSINDAVIGPALKGIFERRDSVWIRQAILNFDLLLAEKDATATLLFQNFEPTKHPSYNQMQNEDFNLLWEYLKLASKDI